MYNWFECKIKYDKLMDTGMQKSVTEPYWSMHSRSPRRRRGLLRDEALYHRRILGIRYQAGEIRESFFNDSGDRYYALSSILSRLTRRAGRRKDVCLHARAGFYPEGSGGIVEAEMKKTMIDYAIVAVTETAIIDVFPYSEKKTIVHQPTRE